MLSHSESWAGDIPHGVTPNGNNSLMHPGAPSQLNDALVKVPCARAMRAPYIACPSPEGAEDTP